MATIGVPMSRADLDAPVAEHFAKAKWLLVVESLDRCTFVKNGGVDGRSVVAELASRGCTDVVARHMGPGAYAHATGAGIKVWQADEGVTARAAAQRLAAGALRPLAPDREQVHAHHHG